MATPPDALHCPQCGTTYANGTLICTKCRTILPQPRKKRGPSALFLALLLAIITALVVYIIVLVRQILAGQFS